MSEREHVQEKLYTVRQLMLKIVNLDNKQDSIRREFQEAEQNYECHRNDVKSMDEKNKWINLLDTIVSSTLFAVLITEIIIKTVMTIFLRTNSMDDFSGDFLFIAFVIYIVNTPNKNFIKKLLYIILVPVTLVFVARWFIEVIKSPILVQIIAIVSIVITYFVTVWLKKRWNNWLLKQQDEVIVHNQIVDQYNQELEQHIVDLYVQHEQTLNQLETAKKNLLEYGKGWYPADYYTFEAIDFFINSFENFTADTIKEVVQLYKEEKHRQYMENKQQEILNTQINQNIALLKNAAINSELLNELRANNRYKKDIDDKLHRFMTGNF